MLIKAPILYMPNFEGRFHLYSDMSKFATGSTLSQIQNGMPRLIAYASKTLPEAVRSYSITELELCGFVINIAFTPIEESRFQCNSRSLSFNTYN